MTTDSVEITTKSIVPTLSIFFDFDVTNETVKLTDTSHDPFDHFYTFIYQNGLNYETFVQDVKDARMNGFDSLISWTPPFQNMINIPVIFDLTFTDNSTNRLTTAVNRYFHYPLFTQEVINLVSEGRF